MRKREENDSGKNKSGMLRGSSHKGEALKLVEGEIDVEKNE